jgi:hypothetical protein
MNSVKPKAKTLGEAMTVIEFQQKILPVYIECIAPQSQPGLRSGRVKKWTGHPEM